MSSSGFMDLDVRETRRVLRDSPGAHADRFDLDQAWIPIAPAVTVVVASLGAWFCIGSGRFDNLVLSLMFIFAAALSAVRLLRRARVRSSSVSRSHLISTLHGQSQPSFTKPEDAHERHRIHR